MTEPSKEAQEKITKLQMYEQNLQALLGQKQQFQGQLLELDTALGEVTGSTQVFKILGNVMIASDVKAVEEDLRRKREIVELRMQSMDKQEKAVREKAKKLQEDVLQSLKE